MSKREETETWTVWHDGDNAPFSSFWNRAEAEKAATGDFDYIEEDDTGRQWAWNKHTRQWDEL